MMLHYFLLILCLMISSCASTQQKSNIQMSKNKKSQQIAQGCATIEVIARLSSRADWKNWLSWGNCFAKSLDYKKAFWAWNIGRNISSGLNQKVFDLNLATLKINLGDNEGGMKSLSEIDKLPQIKNLIKLNIVRALLEEQKYKKALSTAKGLKANSDMTNIVMAHVFYFNNRDKEAILFARRVSSGFYKKFGLEANKQQIMQAMSQK